MAQPNTGQALAPTQIFSPSSESAKRGELAITPATEQAVTEIKLAAQLALMNPRDVQAATDVLLDLCEDPIFADEAIWEKKQGKKKDASGRWVDNYIDGFSIRFVEEAIVTLRHFRSTTTIVLDTQGDGRMPGQRTVAVSVWDCQSNASHSDQIHILKVVERSSAQYRENDVMYERMNSENKTVFGLHATHAEVKTMQAAEVSKMVRTLALRLIPSKLKRVCYDRCQTTMRAEVEKDLPKARKSLLAAFAGIKITREMLEDHLRHSFDATTGEEIASLQNVGKAIKAGETTWKEYTEPPIDAEGEEVEDDDQRPEPERGRMQAPPKTSASPTEHAGKAGSLKSTPPGQTLELTGEDDAPAPTNKDALYRRIDDLLGILASGDQSAYGQYESAARSEAGIPETGDLSVEQLQRLVATLERAKSEMA